MRPFLQVYNNYNSNLVVKAEVFWRQLSQAA